MMKRAIYVFIILIINFIGLQAQNNSYILKINNVPVYKEEFIKIYEKNSLNKKELYTKKDIEDYINLFTIYKLKLKEAYNLRLDTIQSLQSEYKKYAEQLTNHYLIDKQYIDQRVPMYYNRMAKERKTAHIMIKLAPDASPSDTLKAFNKISEIRNLLNAKKKNFEEIAKIYSEDPKAKENGGILGYLSAFMTFPNFENAIYNTPIGSYSGIVRSIYGYHIVYPIAERTSQGKVQVAHIFIADKDSNDIKNKTAESKINEFYNLYKQNKISFDEGVKNYSMDESSKANNGILNPFGSSEMVPEFEEKSFGLKQTGEVSSPFRSQFGWHIVKLIKKIPLGSMEESTNFIKSTLTKDEFYNELKLEFYAQQRKTLGFSENKVALEGFIRSISDTTFIRTDWKISSVDPTTICTINKKNFSVSNFAEFIQNKYNTLVSSSKKDFITSLFKLYIDRLVIEESTKNLEIFNLEYKNLLQEYQDGLLIFEIMDREIWKKIQKDTLGLKSYYETIKQNYTYKDRIEASVLYCANESLAKKVAQLLKRERPKKIETIIKKSKDSSNFSLVEGKYEKGQFEILQQFDWKEKTTSPVIKDKDGLYVIIQYGNLIQNEPKELKEIRGIVSNLYQSKIENDWIALLKSKYKIELHQETINSLIKK